MSKLGCRPCSANRQAQDKQAQNMQDFRLAGPQTICTNMAAISECVALTSDIIPFKTILLAERCWKQHIFWQFLAYCLFSINADILLTFFLPLHLAFILSDFSFGILSGIIFSTLSGRYSNILTLYLPFFSWYTANILTFYLTYILTFYPTFYLTSSIWHPFRHFTFWSLFGPTNKISDRMPDKLSEYLPDRKSDMSDYMSDGMPSECHIKRQNVCQIECQKKCRNTCQIMPTRALGKCQIEMVCQMQVGCRNMRQDICHGGDQTKQVNRLFW